MPAPRAVSSVHDWLTGMRGGEKCLEVLCRRWPDAGLYTLLHRHGTVSDPIARLQPRTSFLQHFPGVHRYYRYLLPLMPAAVRALRLPPCDLVVSFSHCVAKAVRVPRGVPHVCYCFTPMRYAWHMRDAYFGAGRVRGLKARLLGSVLTRLRDWDRETAAGVTHFVAISETVRRRIAECYGRDSAVIYPPVDTDYYCPAPVPREDYYLALSAFAPYKRIDLAVEACNRLRRPLVIIGSGQDEARLRARSGPTVRFLGWQPDAVIRDHLRRCRAQAIPRRGGRSRHRPGRGDGVRRARNRLRGWRRHRDRGRPRVAARADGTLLRRTDGRMPRRHPRRLRAAGVGLQPHRRPPAGVAFQRPAFRGGVVRVPGWRSVSPNVRPVRRVA